MQLIDTNFVINILLFLLTYVIIYYFADYLIDLLEEFIENYTISPVVVGILILGIDLEESIVSITASINSLPYLAIGNLIGNTVLAIVIAFGIPVFFLKYEYQQIPLYYYGSLIFASISLLFSSIFPSLIFFFAIVNIFIFFGYILRSFKLHNSYKKTFKKDREEDNGIEQEEYESKKFILAIKVFLVIGIIFISGDILVLSAEGLIKSTGLTESFFGLVVMAFVTNVEEFWLIVNAIKKGQTELGISAQIGKILWNITLIFGICGIILYQYTFTPIMLYSSLIFISIVILLVFNLLRKNLSNITGIGYIIIMLIFLIVNSVDLL